MTAGYQDNERMQHDQLVRRRLTKKEKHQSRREAYGRKLYT